MKTGAVGILGVGRLGEAIAKAVLSQTEVRALHVTRRSAGRVARLSEADQRVRPGDAAAIARDCDILIVALRPDDARSLLPGIAFEVRHQIISAMAEIGLDELSELTRGAGGICRLLVLPSVTEGRQLLPVFPASHAAEHVFGRQNSLLVVESEEQLMTYWSITSLLSSIMMIGDVAERWLVSSGIERERATAYARTLYSDVHAASASGFAEGLDHASTPGGLNVAMYERMRQAGVEEQVATGLDQIRRRLLAGMARNADQVKEDR